MFEHRLLLLTEMFPPARGGVQAYLAGLWGELPPKTSWVVVSPQRGDNAWDASQRYSVARVPMGAWTYPRWRPAWQAAREIVRRERIEAIICGKALFEGRAALRLHEEFHVPFIVCTYAMEIPVWLGTAKTRRDLRAVLQDAARVLVINEQTKQVLRTFGVPEGKLVKLYPGVAEEFFAVPPDAGVFRSRFGLDGKRVIVSVARLVPRKGLDVLIRAFAEVRRSVTNAHLLIAGDGPERDHLALLIREAHQGDSVTLLGEVSPDDLRGILAVAEFFALTPKDLPNDPEGFGIVYLEAAAAGKTSIGSSAGGVPEAVLDGTTGLLVPPDDGAATARAMRRLFENGDLLRRLQENARSRAEKEFRWKGRAFLFQGVVHAVVSERAPPGSAWSTA